MKLRSQTPGAAASITVSIPMVLAPGNAAGAASSLTLNRAYVILLNASPDLCLKTNGISQQLTVGTRGCAHVTVTAASYGGYADYYMTDSHGNCIRATNSNEVETVTGPCGPDDGNSFWNIGLVSGSNIYVAINVGRAAGSDGGAMETTGTNPGDNVWVGPIRGYHDYWVFSKIQHLRVPGILLPSSGKARTQRP